MSDRPERAGATGQPEVRLAPVGSPTAEIPVDTALVHRLLETQAVAWSKLSIEPFDEGWDNRMFRLGGSHLVRIPRRQSADILLRNEQLILPFLQSRLNIPIPVPVICGQPGPQFPWHWSVIPFFQGETVSRQPLARQGVSAWAAFMANLHRPYHSGADPTAPTNPYRGVDINVRQTSMADRVQELERLGEPIPDQISDIWQLALSQPPSPLRVWIHGDPHARNVLCNAGSLSAVIDWGDVTTGDPASDLGSFWMLIQDSPMRNDAIAQYLAMIRFPLTPSEATSLMRRARGWAAFYGATLLATGLADHPKHAAMGRSTIKCLMDPVADLPDA